MGVDDSMISKDNKKKLQSRFNIIVNEIAKNEKRTAAVLEKSAKYREKGFSLPKIEI